MQKTITPIDNTVYVEREYHSNKIQETIESSMKAQKDWSNLAVSERVELLNNFVDDFLSRSDVIGEELSRQIGRPISQASGELNGFNMLRFLHACAISLTLFSPTHMVVG